ncbi:hypothetical protein EI613_32300 (plasmid) [Azospirillum sp. 412522]|nr:HAD hydrolase-like protein [Azospirillum sp. 412522]MBY6266532.1 hypothetical protein [Azospirillum sp. 412522]
MTAPSPFRPVVARLASGTVSLLSLDVFDTVVLRRLPRPADLFLLLGRRLADDGLLMPGHDAASFAAVRFQCEGIARADAARRRGSREVTLDGIWAAFPDGIAAADRKALAAREMALERSLCFPAPDAFGLLAATLRYGVPVAFVSDTYLPRSLIHGLLEPLLAEMPPAPASWMMLSHEAGLSKAEGLLERLAAAGGLPPERILHVGDDPDTDGAGAARAGVPVILLPAAGGRAAGVGSAAEWPALWHERARRLSSASGDFGVTAVRRRHGSSAGQGADAAFHRYGAVRLGPVLAGFAGWAAERVRGEGGDRLLCLMRAGHLLAPLVQAMTGGQAGQKDGQEEGPKEGIPVAAPLWLNRAVALHAGLADDDPAAVADCLSLSGRPAAEMLRRLLPGPDGERAAAELRGAGPAEMAAALCRPPLLDRLLAGASDLRGRLLAQLRLSGARLDGGPLFLADLGYAATIQRGLQRALRAAGIGGRVHGFYLVTATECLATQREGGIVEGYLGQNGNPNDLTRCVCRSPEVLEQSCATPEGSLCGYGIDGRPLLEPRIVGNGQAAAMAAVQAGVLAFARDWRRHLDAVAARGEGAGERFADPALRAQLRALLLHLVVHPAAEEAERFGAWLYDDGAGPAGTGSRPLAAMDGAFPATAERVAAIPRDRLHWLFAATRLRDPALHGAVARIMLRSGG